MQFHAEMTEIERGIKRAVARIGKRGTDRLADEMKRGLLPSARAGLIRFENEQSFAGTYDQAVVIHDVHSDVVHARRQPPDSACTT